MAFPSWFGNPLARLGQRWVCGPLCIWGKLPGHGDYLRRHTTAAHTKDWQSWVTRVWNLRPHAALPRAARISSSARPDWMELEPRKTQADLSAVPVTFVMQPGVMPFSGGHYVRGVLMASHDQLGRAFPLIVFQLVSPRWMRRTLAAHKQSDVGSSAVPLSGNGNQDVLFWLSRLMARTHAAEKGWAEFALAVDKLDALYRPHWRSLIGAAPTPPDKASLEAVLTQYCNEDTCDSAYGLRGVQQLPWANWPSRILRAENPTNAFWQQDIQGGYVNAGENLGNLWGGRT